MSRGWIGVDLDGTLAYYDHWRGEDHIGGPIPPMVSRIKWWLAHNTEVRVFTARASHMGRTEEQRLANISFVKVWCRMNIGVELEVTAEKDMHMLELWDDRCVRVNINTGNPVRRECQEEGSQSPVVLDARDVGKRVSALFGVARPEVGGDPGADPALDKVADIIYEYGQHVVEIERGKGSA